MRSRSKLHTLLWLCLLATLVALPTMAGAQPTRAQDELPPPTNDTATTQCYFLAVAIFEIETGIANRYEEYPRDRFYMRYGLNIWGNSFYKRMQYYTDDDVSWYNVGDGWGVDPDNMVDCVQHTGRGHCDLMLDYGAHVIGQTFENLVRLLASMHANPRACTTTLPECPNPRYDYPTFEEQEASVGTRRPYMQPYPPCLL